VNAEAKINAALGRDIGVTLDEAGLHFDRTAHGVDDAPELDNTAIARALDDASVMNGDDGVDKIAAKGSQAREDAVFVRAGEPAVADHISDQDCLKFAGLAHPAPLGR
jgi:hypothetical protein